MGNVKIFFIFYNAKKGSDKREDYTGIVTFYTKEYGCVRVKLRE